MATRIKLKNSVVLDKVPTTSDIEVGELALNCNSGSPGAYIQDSGGSIVKLAGAGSITTPDATEAIKGIAKIATSQEVTTGTDDTKIITPAKLAAVIPSSATETVEGIAEIATSQEVTTGTDDTKIITPAKLAAVIPSSATETVEGIAEIATTTEVTAGVDDTKIITPTKLANAGYFKSGADASFGTVTATSLSGDGSQLTNVPYNQLGALPSLP